MRQRIGINDTCHELYEYAVSDASDGPQNFEVEHRKKSRDVCSGKTRYNHSYLCGVRATTIAVYESVHAVERITNGDSPGALHRTMNLLYPSS